MGFQTSAAQLRGDIGVRERWFRALGFCCCDLRVQGVRAWGVEVWGLRFREGRLLRRFW